MNVKSTGTYVIKTDAVNGYAFSSSGRFNAIGSNTVKLAGKGKPLAAGTNDFTVSFNTSVCHIKITVLPVGGPWRSLRYRCKPCMNSWPTITDESVSVIFNFINVGEQSCNAKNAGNR